MGVGWLKCLSDGGKEWVSALSGRFEAADHKQLPVEAK